MSALPRQFAVRAAFSPYLDRAALKGREAIISQMADDIRLFAATRGDVTEDDLSLAGWTATQLQSFGKDAAARARRLAAGR